MKNWTIGKRITAGFAAIIFMVAALAVTSFILLRQARMDAEYLTAEALPGAVTMNDIGNRTDRIQLDVLRILLAKTPEERQQWEADITLQRGENTKSMDAYEKNIHDAEDRQMFNDLAAARAQYITERDAMFTLLNAGKADEALAYNADHVRTAYKALGEIADKMVAWNTSNAVSANARSSVAVKRADLVTTGTASVVILVAVIFAALTVLSLKRVLTRLALALDDSSNQAASAAGQVSASSQTLAEGASEQAASIEETSSSLEEMSSMTKRNAENAQKANDLAKQARAVAERGSGDMQTMATAMQSIKTSSDDIAKIIKTIDEIAFQTNILALNAAVEAARAGEAGMGFAVVADEVRNLAQRSAQAAKETAAKIEGAISNTAQGVQISTKVAEVLKEIVTNVRQVDELIAEVSGASREQTQGITQINSAVGQMDKVTQSNAASAEETAAAAEELNAQALTMKQAVGELLTLVSGKATVTRQGFRPQESSRPVLNPSLNIRTHGNGKTHFAKAAVTKRAEPVSLSTGRNEIPLDGDFKDF